MSTTSVEGFDAYNSSRSLRFIVSKSRTRRQSSMRIRWCITFTFILFYVRCALTDDYAQFVKEVLNEHEEHYNDDNLYGNPTSDDNTKNQTAHEEEIRRQQEEEELQKKAEKERLDQINEKIEREREARFEAELARMTKEKQKAAMKQKKVDAKIVKKVLWAAKNGDHYGVLGLWNVEVIIPERKFHLPFMKAALRIPGVTLFHISSSDIKKAYREKAKVTHPDKNRDGRANQAFVAVEESASLLVDEIRRKEYDNMIRDRRLKRRKEASGRIRSIVEKSSQTVLNSISIVRRILGPFAFPVSVIGVLLI